MVTGLAAYTIDNPSLVLWHQHLGHLGEQSILKLKSMSTGLVPVSTGTMCEHCLKGRMNECPHKKPFAPGKHFLDFIHTDIGGPFQCIGHEGSQYWVTFFNDFTKDAEAVPIAIRDEFFREIKKFLDCHERPEQRCHRIRLDDSGEARLIEFRDWCTKKGIHLKVTPTEQHESNGAAERLNWSLREKLHPTLINTGLPLKYWPDILKAILHIRTRCPSATLGMTPYEKRFGQKPDLAHLRIIGSSGYTLKKSSKRRKLADERSERCKLLNFDDGSIYVVLLKNGRIIRTNNIVFKEQDIILATHKAPDQIHVPVDPPPTPPLANDPIPKRSPSPPSLPHVSVVVPQKRMRAEDFYDDANDAGELADVVHPPKDDRVDDLEALIQDLVINPLNPAIDPLHPDNVRTATTNSADGNSHQIATSTLKPHPETASRVSTRATKG